METGTRAETDERDLYAKQREDAEATFQRLTLNYARARAELISFIRQPFAAELVEALDSFHIAFQVGPPISLARLRGIIDPN